ncbi:MAG: AI-2E family transporter [Bradyrhizobiaceae bacterium]|nr:AI-2E family transporter [Bradyrhizobiaceae bacterium]
MNWDTQRIARTLLVIAVVFASVWMLWRFLPALAWAGVLAVATWPLRQIMASREMGETAIATLLTLALAAFLIVPLVLIGIEAAHERVTIAQWLHDIRENGFGTPDWLSHLPYIGDRLATWWEANLARPEAASVLVGRIGMLNLTRTVGIELANRVMILVFTLLALFFLYRDGPRVMKQAIVISDRLWGPSGASLGRHFVSAVRGTINGLVLVGLAEGVLLGIGYAFSGLPHPVLLGLATAVLATVPFGAPVVFVACGIVLLIQSQTTAAIVLVAFGSVVVFIADHFVRPILISGSTRLPFLWVLLGIFSGLETFGLVGLFLGPAIMAVLVEIWRDASHPTDGPVLLSKTVRKRRS